MNNARGLKACLTNLGYRAGDVFTDFRFTAVDQPSRPVRKVEVAAFLEGPASYRTAALGVVRASTSESALEVAQASRSLGAPFLVVIEADEASVWTYTNEGATKLTQAGANQWESLLADRGTYGPGPIRQLKALHVRDDKPVQGALFDPRTLYGIQACTQQALDDMLASFLAYFGDSARVGQLTLKTHYEVLFPLVFRLLAGKILIDRDDSRIADVDKNDPLQVIGRVEKLYSLKSQSLLWSTTRKAQLARAWATLLNGLFVRNVAAEDLAFVYETTLVTHETRKRFGTHSTPQSAADYVIRSLQLPTGFAATDLKVYEPFAGACVFLTAALRRFKEILPSTWSVKQTHEHLVRHFNASEIDPFACEIARLALILADYPNHNGWKIEREDLFAAGRLAQRVAECDVLLSNPPYEDFVVPVPGLSIHQPAVLLDAVLATPPAYVGIVLPSGFSSQRRYSSHVEQLTKIYEDVEIVQLPEGAFRHASIGAEVLIAQKRRDMLVESQSEDMETTVRWSSVSRPDWDRFVTSLRTSESRCARVNPISTPGLTGLRPLRELWEYLAENDKLQSVAILHRGLEWVIEQGQASRPGRTAGFRPGLHRREGALDQFEVLQHVYLDVRPEHLRGKAIEFAWSDPKIILNAIRTSRGPWRLAAAVDTKGLLVSQQFYGVWLKGPNAVDETSHRFTLPELCAVLNSPVANAFSFAHDNQRHVRIDTMRRMPLPARALNTEIPALIEAYAATVEERDDGPLFGTRVRKPSDVLMEIDALVLEAYDLPPRLERTLLRFLNAGSRPAREAFPVYPGTGHEEGAIGLARRLRTKAHQGGIRSSWNALLTPLPAQVALVLDQG